MSPSIASSEVWRLGIKSTAEVSFTVSSTEKSNAELIHKIEHEIRQAFLKEYGYHLEDFNVNIQMMIS